VLRRRRTALNEAVHELRRPLQALALATANPIERPAIEHSVRLAATALERLEREINGEAPVLAPEALAVEPLLEATLSRWRPRAGAVGADLALRLRAGAAVVRADPYAISQALDNLILNAIEHGGPAIRVETARRADRLLISVRDSGRRRRRPPLALDPTRWRERVGAGRRGHGLRVVRRTVAAHGGGFSLRRWHDGALAAIELPLAERDAA